MNFDESGGRHIRCLMFCRTDWSGIFGGKGGRGERSRQPHPENADGPVSERDGEDNSMTPEIRAESEKRRKVQEEMRIQREIRKKAQEDLERGLKELAENEQAIRAAEESSGTEGEIPTEDLKAIYDEIWKEMSSEKRREVQLGPKLSGNVIEADPRFAALKRRIQERRDFEKTERKREREAATRTSRPEAAMTTSRRRRVDPNLEEMRQSLDDFNRFLPPRPAPVPTNPYEPSSGMPTGSLDPGALSDPATLNPFGPDSGPKPSEPTSGSDLRSTPIFSRFALPSQQLPISSGGFPTQTHLFPYNPLQPRSIRHRRLGHIPSSPILPAATPPSAIMPSNPTRRKLIRIEVPEKDPKDVKELYREGLSDILTIINEAKDQIPPFILRKMNKVVENVEREEEAMDNSTEDKNKASKP